MYTNRTTNQPFGGTTSNQSSNYGAKSHAAGTDNFPKGINFYPPHEKAPEFVKGAITINRDTLMKWLSEQKETVRLDLKESKEGKLYLAINTYEPKSKQ